MTKQRDPLATKADEIESENFRQLMEIVREHISYEQKNLIIHLWVDTLSHTRHARWSEGYDAGYEQGKKSCLPFQGQLNSTQFLSLTGWQVAAAQFNSPTIVQNTATKWVATFANSTTTRNASAEMATYEGWENYETWNCSLWINNDEPLYRAAVKFMGVNPDPQNPYKAFIINQQLSDKVTPDDIDYMGDSLDYKALDRMMLELIE